MNIGLWIWNEADAKPPAPSLDAWRAAGVSRAFLKCGDGPNVWPQFARDIPSLKALGFEVYAWQYVYGTGDETGPAIAALQAGADGFIVDAEGEWELSTTANPSTFLRALRQWTPGKPILLSSFGQPDVHLGMRWPLWDTLIDGYIPQTFPQAWNLSIADAITKMYQSHAALGLTRPIYPAAYLYEAANPVVHGADVTEFLGQAQAGGYDAVSFWRDGIMGQDCVDAIAAFVQPAPSGLTLEERVAKLEAFNAASFKGWPA